MIKGWKTLLAAAAIAALGVVQASLGTVVSATWSGIGLIVIAGVVTWLRTITDTPVGKST